MAAKKRSGKKAPSKKARSKKASTRASASKKTVKKASKKKKKASKKASAVAAAPVAKKAKKKAGKKRAAKRTPAPPPEPMLEPEESEGGEASADDDSDDGDGDEEPSDDDDEPDEGEPAPSFELVDQDGQTVSSADLAGAPYVLYFYPKDDTPGCTTEACGFRDALSELEAVGVSVIGVSPDSAASHKKFAGKYGLGFRLLSDPEKSLAKAYGTWVLKKNYGREFMGVERSTFLVGADGRIKQTWRRVRVNGHVDAVKAAAARL
jgi:peroxiredoxin Q/BCP